MAALSFAVLPETTQAQTGKITGIVTDVATGAPLPGAQVYLDGTGRGALTQENGRYFIVNVPAGNYTVVAQFIGYATERRDNVTVHIDITTQQNFALAVEAVALGGIVVSTERVPLIPEHQTGSVDMVTKQQIEALPVVDIVGVLELTQGFIQVPVDNTTVVTYQQQRQGVTALRIRGGRGSETTFQIDGIPINNFVLGGPALDITNKAIEQVAVFKGHLDPQYGNALSGVIAYATPEGSEDLEGTVELRSSAFGGWVGNEHDAKRDFDMFEGFVSGSVPGTRQRLRFFVAGRQQYGAARAYEFDDEVYTPTDYVFWDPLAPYWMDVIPGWRAVGFDEKRDVYAKLTYSFTPAMKLSGSWIGYEREHKPFDFDWQFAGSNPLDHMLTVRDSAEYLRYDDDHYWPFLVQNSFRHDRQLGILRWDHTLGRSAYGFTFGVFDQRRETCNHMSGVCLENRFTRTDAFSTFMYPHYNDAFKTGPTSGTDYYWGGEDLTTYTGRFDVQSQISDHHHLTAGVFFQQHDVRYDEWENVGQTDVDAVQERFVARPWDGALYIQDRIEYDFLTLKLGARFDYGRATGVFLANPVDPTNGTNALDVCADPLAWQNVQVRTYDPKTKTSWTDTLSADPNWTLPTCTVDVRREAGRIASSDDFSESKPRVQFSPRIGVSFPVTESASLFLNFGRYSQNPILINNYRATGIGTPREGTVDGPWISSPTKGSRTPFLGNPHLLTETSTTYEIGYVQEIADTWALQAVLFAKDQTGLTGVSLIGQPPYLLVDPGATYGWTALYYTILTNQDFATSRGLELQVRRRLRDYWAMQLNYGYSSCRTNAADPEREYEAVVIESDPQIRDEIRCEIDQPHKFTGVWTLAFRQDTPPGAGWLRNSNLSFVFKAASGLPYTPTLTFRGLGGEEEQFERYSGRAPTTWQLDMQLRKDFAWRNVRYGFFIDVWNLTDRKNCIQVFETSGSCIDGAEDQDRRRVGDVQGEETSSTIYDRPQFIGQRRTITAGIRVVF